MRNKFLRTCLLGLSIALSYNVRAMEIGGITFPQYVGEFELRQISQLPRPKGRSLKDSTS